MEKKENEKTLILVVEDDPLLVKMYRTKFASEGFSVLSADDGMKGLKLALEKMPVAIVLDIMMPKLSGMDMLQRLRADERGKDIVVIVLSNLSSEEESKRAHDLGVKEYLLKANYTPKEVVDKVKQYLK